MKRKVLYLHGLNSSGNSATVKRLQNVDYLEIIAPTYDPTNFEETYEMLYSLCLKEDIDVVVGTSAGGYWALRCAMRAYVFGHTVSINPSLFPKDWSLKNNCPEITSEGIKKSAIITGPIPVTVLLGEKDDVIPLEKTLSVLKEANVYTKKIKNLEHRISDESFEEVLKAINWCSFDF